MTGAERRQQAGAGIEAETQGRPCLPPCDAPSVGSVSSRYDRFVLSIGAGKDSLSLEVDSRKIDPRQVKASIYLGRCASGDAWSRPSPARFLKARDHRMRLSPSLLVILLVMTGSRPLSAADYWGQSPTVAVPNGYVAAYPATAGPEYVVKYAPSTTTYVDPSSVPPLSGNGVYQAQRPTYYDNPSVYTGGIVGSYPPVEVAPSGYQSFRTPLNESLRGNAPQPTAMVVAPTTYYSAYDGSIPGQPMTVTTPYGAPATALPSTPVAPLYAPAYVAPADESGCCLSRFCRKLFGTSYSTSYYRAPVTYYRPVTSADPVTGAPVIVQQPCTSYVQQVQRTPATTLQFGQSPVASSPTPAACPNGCPNACVPAQGGCETQSNPWLPPTVGASGSVTQAGAYGQADVVGGAGGVSQIPTIAPPVSSATQSPYSPNTAPLTGTPTIAPPSSSDLSPVNQPSLDGTSVPSIPPSNISPPASTLQPPSESGSPQWQLQNADDSTALIRPRPRESSQSSRQEDNPPSLQGIMDSDNFTRAEPIEAPADYVAPFRRQTRYLPLTTPVNLQGSSELTQPRSGSESGASNLTSISARVPGSQMGDTRSSSNRFITQPAGQRFVSQPHGQTRDSSWTAVQP